MRSFYMARIQASQLSPIDCLADFFGHYQMKTMKLHFELGKSLGKYHLFCMLYCLAENLRKCSASERLCRFWAQIALILESRFSFGAFD